MGKPRVHEPEMREGIGRVGSNERLNSAGDPQEIHKGHHDRLAGPEPPDRYPDHDAAQLKRQILLKRPGVSYNVPSLPFDFPNQEKED